MPGPLAGSRVFIAETVGSADEVSELALIVERHGGDLVDDDASASLVVSPVAHFAHSEAVYGMDHRPTQKHHRVPFRRC